METQKPTVAKVLHQYSPEYPDDPKIKRIIHVMTDGTEVVVFDATRPEVSDSETH